VFKGAASTSTLSTIASAAPKQTPASLWMFILIARLLSFPYSTHIPQMIGDGVLKVAQFGLFGNVEHGLPCATPAA